MAKTNTKRDKVFTHEGAPAVKVNPELQLRRSVLSCLLWESEFYEDGASIAERIAATIPQVKAEKVASIAVEARSKYHLRHAPLWIIREMARLDSHKGLVADTLEAVIQRADELTEFVALYWKDGRQPLSAQVKKGLARAFQKFDEYALAKYDRPGQVKLRDVLFLTHPTPKDDEQAALWKRLIDGKMKTPDTWETALSGGESKKETFERLMSEGKLGGLAFLRNLRNISEAGVDRSLIDEYAETANFSRVLPFRFLVAAAKAPSLEATIEKGLFRATADRPKLPGKTILIVDVSGSMYGGRLSKYSELDRAHVACSLAVLMRELCEDVRIYATAGNDMTRIHQTAEVPARRGFALSDKIYSMCRPLGGGGIFLTPVLRWVKEKEKTADRIVVITDEQDCADNRGSDSPLKAEPFGRENYLINVASYENGIGYGKWTHIDGFSEAVLDWMQAYEATQ